MTGSLTPIADSFGHSAFNAEILHLSMDGLLLIAVICGISLLLTTLWVTAVWRHLWSGRSRSR